MHMCIVQISACDVTWRNVFMDLDSALAERVGQEEVGGCT